MFNPIKKKDVAANAVDSLNRLSSLKHGDESAKKETTPSSQPNNKAGASFSKALNAVRQEVEDTQSGNSPIVNRSPKTSVTFGDAINARREKTMNPFIKISPTFQGKGKAKPKAE